MSSYMQMGHCTENLVGERHLYFDGIILSPLNRAEDRIASDCLSFRKKGYSEIIFDAQLYDPKTTRENIIGYPYFPNDYESANPSNFEWWRTINNKLAEFVEGKGISAVTSPIIRPKSFDNSFYMRSVDIAKSLNEIIASVDHSIRVIQTFLLDDSKLSTDENIFELASTITTTPCKEIYMVYCSMIDPRLELADSSINLALMKLIYLIESSGKKVIMAFCSTDVILFKAAGISSVATGKYFNLRRFSPKRFDEPVEGGGGGPAAYLFAESLLALIRQADIERIQNAKLDSMLTESSSNNEWATIVLEQIHKNPKQAWLKHSWRQYLSWFAGAEKRLTSMSHEEIMNMCIIADNCWKQLDEKSVFLVERKNNGEWIRSWMQSLADFNKWKTAI